VEGRRERTKRSKSSVIGVGRKGKEERKGEGKGEGVVDRGGWKTFKEG